MNYSALYNITDDIERYLGYLKGNELVREYIDAQNLAVEDQLSASPDGGAAYSVPSTSYTSTPEEPEFACDFSALMILVPSPGTEDETPESRRYKEQIAEGKEQSWNNGVAWARGMGADLRSICEPFNQPNPRSLNNIAKALQNLSSGELNGLLPEDFVAHSEGQNFGSTLDNWHGEAADTFQTFYNNLRDRANGYALSIGAAAGWVAGAAGLIAVAQSGLEDFVMSVREGLAIQLEEWAATHGNPQDWEKPDGWGIIGDIADVALDIADLIPVVDKFRKVPGTIKEVAGLIGDVSNVISKADEYIGSDEVPTRPARTEFNVETAADLYTAAANVLHEILEELNTELGHLATGSADMAGSQAGITMLDELQADGDWFPHDVLPGGGGVNVFDTPWTHYTDV